MRRAKTASILFERCLLVSGVMLLAIWVAAQLHGQIFSRLALWQFENAQAATTQNVVSKTEDSTRDVDFSLWAQKRIQAYKSSLLNASGAPLAVLEIAKVKIRVPVYDGTDDLTLNRGVGRITGTAMPGIEGNVGIAGHRDGFFRGLKDIAVGDEIDLTMTQERDTYVVDQIEIVSPADVHVLEPRSISSLTLVTCYPFYFVGDAPQRFIVHASISSRRALVGSGNQPSTTSAGLGKNNKENSQ
ncbi:MAG: class D sortase [Terracidiphilus sp.]